MADILFSIVEYSSLRGGQPGGKVGRTVGGCLTSHLLQATKRLNLILKGWAVLFVVSNQFLLNLRIYEPLYTVTMKTAFGLASDKNKWMVRVKSRWRF